MTYLKKILSLVRKKPVHTAFFPKKNTNESKDIATEMGVMRHMGGGTGKSEFEPIIDDDGRSTLDEKK